MRAHPPVLQLLSCKREQTGMEGVADIEDDGSGETLLRCRHAGLLTVDRAIEQRQNGHLLASLAKLARHLKGNHASRGKPADAIRSFRLNSANVLNVIGRHLVNGHVRYFFSIQATRLQPINGLIGIEVACEGSEVQKISADCVYKVKRPVRSAGADRHQRRPGGFPAAVTNERSQFRNSGSLEKSS